ncbi:MAG: MupG family TIM beta-alpha barrel fold protein, partial [Paraclostridium bifermentans]
MSLGFSVYFGLDNTKDENIQLLKDANELGFTRIFTSLHIPEANYDILKVEVREFFNLAKQYDMDIISDISPNTFKFLDLDNMDLKGLRDMGVKTIRIDFGYTEEEISNMSKNDYGIQIQLNASTVTES